jgi:hypothetical protein
MLTNIKLHLVIDHWPRARYRAAARRLRNTVIEDGLMMELLSFVPCVLMTANYNVTVQLHDETFLICRLRGGYQFNGINTSMDMCLPASVVLKG